MFSPESWSVYRDQATPDINDFFDEHGKEALNAYGLTGLFHNTLTRNVDKILSEGLVPDDLSSTPLAEDIEFARELFIQKGLCDPDTIRSFKTLIEGIKGGRKPGVFLYPESRSNFSPNRGYGIPERMQIFAAEMGYVAAHPKSGPYDTHEREAAKELYYKYRGTILDPDSIHAQVAVLEADPFYPNVINSRLSGEVLQKLRAFDHEMRIYGLGILGTTQFEGIYITGGIAPEALKLHQEGLEIRSILPPNVHELDPSRSRFYNSTNMQRVSDWKRPEW